MSAVPHSLQKVRVAAADDRKRAGSPATIRKWPALTVNHATIGAPVVRRQIEQWHSVSCQVSPSAS